MESRAEKRRSVSGSVASATPAKDARSMKKAPINLPTILTISRIILVAPTMIFVYTEADWAKIVAVSCFIVASITDFIDGYLARKWQQVTDLGKFLDPLADKMLVNLTLLALTVLGIVPVWMFAVILVRDFAVDGLRMMAAGRRVTIAASKLGKLKTLTQMVTVILMMINLVVGSSELSAVNTVLLYAVVILTLWSGVDYLYKGRKLVL